MKKRVLRWILPLVALLAIQPAKAQLDALPIDLGIMAGINVPGFTTNDTGTDIQNKMGWQVGVVSAINFGFVGIEPQLIYHHQGLRLRADEEVYQLKCNTLDLPVTASLGLAKVLRVYAGPVFTLVDNCRQKVGKDLLDFGRIRSSVSYTAGVRIKPLPHLLFDVRYNGQFAGKKRVEMRDGEVLDKINTYNVAFSVGYLF